jgi:hypothetical protein
MNTPKAILIGFAMVAAAVYFSRDVGPAQAATGSPNYSISSGHSGQLWLVDNINKTIRFCMRYTYRPLCDPWESIDKLKEIGK